MLFVTMGIRNLIKHKRKTMLTLLTVLIGFACLLLSRGYVHYCLWGLRESIINGGIGHYQVFKKGYCSLSNENRHDLVISDYRKVLKSLSLIPGVDFIAPRLSFEGLLTHNGQSATVCGYGGWNAEEKKLLAFSSLDKGRFPRKNEQFSLLAGTGLASMVKAQPDDTVTVTVALREGAINAMDFTLSGCMGNQLEELENTFTCIPLETAQIMLDVPESVDSLILMLSDSSLSPGIEKDLAACCERYGLEWRRWDELVPYYGGASAFYSSSMDVAGIVILAIVVFAILNTMLMSVFERMRELGTMRALGTRGGQVLCILGSEGFLLALFGCVAGFILAIIIATIINAVGGIPLPPPPGNTRSYRGMIQLQMMDALYYAVFFVAVAVGASLYPAVKAIRCSIADTLRWM